MTIEIPGVDELSPSESVLVGRIAAWAIRRNRARLETRESLAKLLSAIRAIAPDGGDGHWYTEDGTMCSLHGECRVIWPPHVVKLHESWEAARRACFEEMPR